MAFIDEILNELIECTGMPRDMALELIKEYFDGISAKLENLNNSLNDNNKVNSLRLAHNIKGITANLRLNFLASSFSSLEEAIIAEDVSYIYNLSNQIKISVDQYKEILRYN